MTVWRRLQVLALCALASTQVGWQSYQTKSGIPIRWYDATVPVKVDEALCADLPDDVTARAVRDSWQTWNTVPCDNAPRLVDGGSVKDVDPIVGKAPNEKGNDLVIFEDAAAWRADGASAKVPGVIALTTLFYDPSTGQARSYALEVNDGEFTFSDGMAAGKMDLANTLTHEFGHVLGLDHSTVRAATMYYSATFGDVSKRDLWNDDIDGICTLYGTEYAEIDRSEHGGGGGCAAGTSPGPLAPLALLAGLLAFAWMRSRRS